MPGRNPAYCTGSRFAGGSIQMSLIPLLRLYNDIGAVFGVGRNPPGHLVSTYRFWSAISYLSAAQLYIEFAERDH